MDLETTLATISEYIPESIDRFAHYASAYMPQDLSYVIRHASTYFPRNLSFMAVAEFMLYFIAASLVLGILGRVVLGKRSSLNHSLSSVMGILFIYAATVMVYTFKPWNLEIFLSPLPFVTFAGDYLILLPISDVQFSALCTELLSLVILAFLVNLLDNFLPKGNNIISWYLMRFITIALSMMLHLLVCWAFETYLPELLVKYAPTVLLGILLFMFLSGVLNLLLGLAIAAVNPFMGAMYTFFFSTVIGKQVSKAVFSTIIVTGVFWLMDYFGYTVISISAAALLTYIPLALVLLILWYLIGHVL